MKSTCFTLFAIIYFTITACTIPVDSSMENDPGVGYQLDMRISGIVTNRDGYPIESAEVKVKYALLEPGIGAPMQSNSSSRSVKGNFFTRTNSLGEYTLDVHWEAMEGTENWWCGDGWLVVAISNIPGTVTTYESYPGPPCRPGVYQHDLVALNDISGTR